MKTYKLFVKEHAIVLQIPATRFMKPMASLKLKQQEDYDRDDEVVGKKVFKPGKHMPKDSGGKIDLVEPTRSHSPLKKVKKVDAKVKDGSDHTQPSTTYKGWAFTQKVPNYVDG